MFGSFYYGSCMCGMSIYGEQMPLPYNPSHSGDYIEHILSDGDIVQGSDFSNGQFIKYISIDGNMINGYIDNSGIYHEYIINSNILKRKSMDYSGEYKAKDYNSSGRYIETIIDTGSLPEKEIEDN